VARQVEAEAKGLPRHLDVLAAPMAPAENGPVWLVVVRDITDLARAAAMKAEFVANASHELRTPLTALRAAADSLSGIDPTDQDDIGRLADIIDRQVGRLEALTQDLLLLHSVENGKRPLRLEAFSAASLLAWIGTEFADRAKRKGVVLEQGAPAPDFAFTSDRVLLELILQNLVDNAIKFTPAGGRVACAVRHEGESVRLSVSDTGCGIPREHQARVFERFHQADASRNRAAGRTGTGLGLAIVKHACERLGGAVSLMSELGKGTTVTVLVPDRTTRPEQ
jgi:two-component system phosphate regulon sensor histidine kinase PhoR